MSGGEIHIHLFFRLNLKNVICSPIESRKVYISKKILRFLDQGSA